MRAYSWLQTFVSRAKFFLWRLHLRDFWYLFRARGVLADAHSIRPPGRTIRLIGNFPGLWQRTIEQTPGGMCKWGDTIFVASGGADLYVVLNDFPSESEETVAFAAVPEEQLWGLHMEPEEYVSLLKYDNISASRFSRFYTNCESLIKKGGVFHASPPYVHFLTGKSWDFLASATAPRKRHSLGIICSSLKTLEGHRRRMDFLVKLEQSGVDFQLWGRGDELQRFKGYRGFAMSKWNAHSQCRYSIVLENSISPLYWTEKLADCLLSFSYPLYYGAPKAGDYLPRDSFREIDIMDENCVDLIRSIIASDTYERSLPAIQRARDVLLKQQNLYAFLAREAELHFKSSSGPDNEFSLAQSTTDPSA